MELLLRHVKGCHGSHKRNGGDGHRYHHLSESEALICSSFALSHHEIVTFPVRLSVSFAMPPCLSLTTIVVAVADRPVGWKRTSGPALGSSTTIPFSP